MGAAVSLSGQRGVIRVATNPGCEKLAAMAVEGVRETDFYRQITGNPYPKEYGEREAARRRGRKFEDNLNRGDGELLKQAFAEFCGVPAGRMAVFDLETAVAGGTAARLNKRARTRGLLRDASQGQARYHVLVQPHFALNVPGFPRPFIFAADLAVLHSSGRYYVPGEIKSFIDRDNELEPGDLRLTRLQCGAELIALRHEMNGLGVDYPNTQAFHVFATPYGLSPSRPRLEDHANALSAIERAITVYADAKARVEGLRSFPGEPLGNFFEQLRPNFVEGCHASCVMAEECAHACQGTARQLGDDAHRLLGDAVTLPRLVDLIGGATPANAVEAAIATEGARIAADLGIAQIFAAARRVA